LIVEGVSPKEKEKVRSVIGRLMSALAALGVFRLEEWESVGLGELLDYIIRAHRWIFGISEEPPGSLSQQLGEEAKKVIEQLVERKRAEVRGEEESLRQEGYSDREIQMIYNLYEKQGEWAREALDWLVG
jgi:ribulose kinase